MTKINSVLIVQTAFIGDVILATSMIETLKAYDLNLKVSILVRKGNDELLKDNPHIHQLLIWDKTNKLRSLVDMISSVRTAQFDAVINVQRFFSTGLLTALSRAKIKVGFNKNPLSLFYRHKVTHKIPDNGKHEIERNHALIKVLFPNAKLLGPKLYFGSKLKAKVDQIIKLENKDFVVMAPKSVWKTKEWPLDKWKALLNHLGSKYRVFFIGAPGDKEYIEALVSTHDHYNLCGQLSLRESAYLMSQSLRLFANDSAPLHLASATNTPTTAIFCSTIPQFGYYPLADNSKIFEVTELDCRPCGLHGKKACPKGHFLCAQKISAKEVAASV